MPPTKPTLKVFKFVSKEDLKAYQTAVAETKAKNLIEIENQLMVENYIYFDIEEILKTPILKHIGKMILSYLDFQSLIESSIVSKTWYLYLEKERGLWITSLRKKMDFLKEGSFCDYNNIYINKKYPRIQVLFRANKNS